MKAQNRIRTRTRAIRDTLAPALVTATIFYLGCALISPTQVAAQQNKEGIGEDVGTFQTVTCPPQTYLVGIKTTVNFWLDYVQIYDRGIES